MSCKVLLARHETIWATGRKALTVCFLFLQNTLGLLQILVMIFTMCSKPT